MHPYLHIHGIQTQAHTSSKHQNKTGIIVFLFKYVLIYTNLLIMIVIY